VTWLRSTGLRLLLAIGLGFALWIFVSYTQNPDRRIPFDSVPVKIEGLQPGLVVVDENGLPRTTLRPVSVTVEAEADVLSSIRVSDLNAFVDLSGRGPGEHNVPVNVRTTRSDLTQLSFSVAPDFLPIRLEQEITRTVPLTIAVAGDVPFSFEKGVPRATVGGVPIERAQVRGPQGRVERVMQVRATANISQLTANYNSPRPLEPVGEDGQVIQGVRVEPATVEVEVPISSSVGIKRVPVVPRVVGEPASGYFVADLSVEPQFVRLTGSSGPLDRVQSVETQAVDLTGARATLVRTVRLQELEGTSLLAGEPLSVTVTVQIEPISRPFQVTLPLPVELTDVSSGFLVSLSPQFVQVTLSGPATKLEALDPSTLVGTVSVRGLGVGTYSRQPTFTLPEGIKQVNEPQVTVVVRLPPSPTPQATSTPAGPATPTPAPAPPETPTAAPTPAPTEVKSPPATAVP